MDDGSTWLICACKFAYYQMWLALLPDSLTNVGINGQAYIQAWFWSLVTSAFTSVRMHTPCPVA